MSGMLGTFVHSNQFRYRFFRHFCFWFFWWIFQGLIYGVFYTETRGISGLTISFGDSLIFLLQHIFLAYGLMYYVIPRIMMEKYLVGIVSTVVLIVTAAFLSPLLSQTLVKTFRELVNYPLKGSSSFYFFMGGLRGSLTVAGFAVAIKLLKHWYVNKVEKEKLLEQNARAQLHMLKAQLQPHFMFNTLNSIYSLSLKQSNQTSEAILRLSHLMRYMLVECNDVTIPLSKEISLLKDYIELEKTRLGKRLDMSVTIDGAIENQVIPPLLLLPYLENSFKYGAHDSMEQAWISMDLMVNKNEMRFKLINSKPPERSLKLESLHVGLDNSRKRLNLLYPNSHELEIMEDADVFIVSLNLSLEKIHLPA
jgi:sensor histidine kinase YesM